MARPSRRGGALPTGAEKDAMVHAMFDEIASRYDLVNRVMTLGLDRGWRRRAVSLLGLEGPGVVLDLACGTGDLLETVRAAGHRGLGADLSFGMLTSARPGRGPVVQADGAALPFADGSLDGLVSGFALRNFADLAGVLAEAGRLVRPGGRMALLEVDTPTSPVLRAGHRIWFRVVVPRLGALLSDRKAYEYLPESVAYLPEPDALAKMVEGAGFGSIQRTRLAFGAVQVVTGTRVVKSQGGDGSAGRS